MKKSVSQIEFGDFQTPLQLAIDVCRTIRRGGINPDVIIEPTVGEGTFLVAAASQFPRAQLRGYEINPGYVREAQRRLAEAGAHSRTEIKRQDFFGCDWEHEVALLKGEILILGNPPWVTSAAIAAANGTNLPAKENFLGLRGIAARTGKSNFDISEWMLIRLLRTLQGRHATIAMLCKTATARKFLRYAWQNHGRLARAELFRIDAATHFNASVDACLLFVRTGGVGPERAKVYPGLAAEQPTHCIGLAGKDVVANVDHYERLRHLDGLCSFQWRSGIKHDCAAVMELRPEAGGYFINNLGERVQLEADYVFPFLKCSDLANCRSTPERAVLVTQRCVGDDTAVIASRAPRTWSYLQRHRAKFNARKSSIYKKSIPFALFGVGEYSFAPWKVAVSGLHRSARFQVIGPVLDRPVFFDDACYFTSFGKESDARTVAAILNSAICQEFLSAIVFPDSKRPITVDLLQRLHLGAMANAAGLREEWIRLERCKYSSKRHIQQAEFAMETTKDVSVVRSGLVITNE